jgi:phasin family protein
MLQLRTVAEPRSEVMAHEETPKSAPAETPKADTPPAKAVNTDAVAAKAKTVKTPADTRSHAPQATSSPATPKAPVTTTKTGNAEPAAKAPTSRKPSPPRKFSGETHMAAAKKDAAKETFETVTAASNEAMKEGFEKSVTAMNDFSAFQKQSVDALIASATTTSKSVEEMNTSALAFAKKSMEDGVAAAKTMAGAKSGQELIEIHADYTKSTLDAYLSEVNKNSDLMSALVKDGFKPLNDQMASAVEAMQSAR